MEQLTLQRKSIEYRKTILKIIFESGAGHTGGSLSCIDILNVLYNSVLHITPQNFSSFDRDHFIQSKGHSVEALYTVLLDCGFYKKEDLGTLNNFNSHFIGHPTKKVLGIEHNTGALGHGLSVAVGMALGLKTDKKNVEKLIKNTVPMKRFGTPEEVADAALFICSDRAKFITGSVLKIDGGQTVGIF